MTSSMKRSLLGIGILLGLGAGWWLRSAEPAPAVVVETPLAAMACDARKEVLRARIATRTACEADADCTSTMACPFGCQIVVSQSELPWLKGEIAAYNAACGPECVYKCAPWTRVTCRDRACVADPR